MGSVDCDDSDRIGRARDARNIYGDAMMTLTTSKPLSDEQRRRLSELLKDALGDEKFIVLEQSMKLERVKPTVWVFNHSRAVKVHVSHGDEGAVYINVEEVKV